MGLLGTITDPWTWALQEVGRLLLRVRALDGSEPDQWVVLVPETSQAVSARGTTVTVTSRIAFSGNEGVGITVTFAGAGAELVDLTAFLNVGATTPSWAYVAVIAEDEPLPPSLAFRLTTPPSTIVSAIHTAVTVRIDTSNDAEPRRVVRLGRADIPTTPAQAKVSVTPAALTAAIAALAAHGLTLTGLPLPVGGTGVITVQAPSAETGPAAFTDPSITTMTDVVATLAKPGGGTLGTSNWQVTVDQQNNSAANQPSTTTLTWGASSISNVGVLVALKDPTVQLGLQGRNSLVSASLTRLPTTVTAVMSAMPDIAFGGPSPDPAAAPPTLDYSANGRLEKLDLVRIVQSTVVTPPPPGGTPAPNSSLHAVAEDVPRRVTVKIGQWNPNHPTDAFIDLGLRNEQGSVDSLKHLSVATAETPMPAPLLTPDNGQQIRRDAATDVSQADLLGLRELTLRVEPRAASTGLQVHYLAAAEQDATITLVDADLASTVVTATRLPTEVTAAITAPEMATVANAQATWSGVATWLAAGVVDDLAVMRTAPPNAASQGIDKIGWTASLTAFPRDVTLNGANDGATQVTTLEWIADTRLGSATADVDVVRYSEPAAPFFWATVALKALARATTVAIMRATPGFDITYSACDAVAAADVRVRSTALITQRPGQFVAFDHARAGLNGIPATVTDPGAVTAGPKLTFRLDTSPSAGLVALVDVPAGTDAIAEAYVRVVDAPTAVVDDFPTPAGVRWVNRPALGPGQVDDVPRAPTGSQFALVLPGLRSARYDGRDGQSLPAAYSIARALQQGEAAFGVEVQLDAAQPFSAELAIDEEGSLSTTWISGRVPSAATISLDGQLAGSTSNGHHVAAEILPAGPEVEALMKRYDRNPDAAPNFTPDAAGVAAEKLARSTMAQLLASAPGRLEVRLDSPQTQLDTFHEMKPTDWFDLSVRRGVQVIPGPAVILPDPAGAPIELAGWISFQHGFADDGGLWADFTQDPRPRADYVVRRDTTVTIIPGAPEPEREVQTTGVGPRTLLTDVQVDSITLVRFDLLRGLEASAQTALAQPGTRPTQRVVALWASEDWDFGLRALHLENGQPTTDLIEGDLQRLTWKTQLLITPEAWNTENGLLRLTARVHVHHAQLTLRGGWERGFPRVEWPTDTPARTGAPDRRRPAGLTALDVVADLGGWMELTHERHWALSQWSPPQYDVPSPGTVFEATDSWRLDCPRPLAVRGWAMTDRPHRSDDGSDHPFVGWLSDTVANASGPTVGAIQGGVRVPEYGPGATAAQADAAWFMRPGEGAVPHSAAIAVDALKYVELSFVKLVDNEGREVPVFVSDDSISFQTGATASSGKLSLANPAGPGKLDVVGWEVDDWEDSPPLQTLNGGVSEPAYQALGVDLGVATPEQIAWSATSEVGHVPGKRPTGNSSVTVSTSGDVNDPSGPDIGPGLLVVNSLDTAANPWAPLVKTITADLSQAPGFVRLATGKHVAVDRFPDGSSTGLSTGGWDRERDFLNDDHSTRQLLGWASGALAGTITAGGTDFRRSRSTIPSSFGRSPSFDMSLIEATITAVPTGPVDLAKAPFAMFNSTSGPQGNGDDTPDDDTAAGLALYGARNLLKLDGTVKAAARYGRTYTTGEPFPVIAVTDDTLTLTLSDFTGRLTVQKREGLAALITFLTTQVAAGAIVAFIAVSWIPGIGIVFAVAVAELGLYTVLGQTTPIIVDDSGGNWYLNPRPSTDLSAFAPYAHGWEHDTWPHNWDLNETIYLIAIFLLIDYANREVGLGWIARQLNKLL